MAQTLNDLFDAAGRAVGAASVQLDAQIARRMGINESDYRCLDLLMEEGPMQAGELARRTGVTAGAITGITSRLERAGYASRRTDDKDSRRVVVSANRSQVEAKLWPLLESLGRRLEALHGSYDDAQRALLLDYLAKLRDALAEEAAAL